MSRVLDTETELELGRIVQRGMHARNKMRDGIELTEDEAQSLAAADSAIETIMAAYERMVQRVAGTYGRCLNTQDYEDAVQEGRLALLGAIHRFEPERGVRVSTAALWWIKRDVRRGAQRRGHALHTPESSILLARRVWERRFRLMEQGLTAKEADAALLESGEVTQRELNTTYEVSRGAFASTLEPTGAGDWQHPIAGANNADYEDSVADQVVERVFWGGVRRAFEALPEQHRTLLLARHEGVTAYRLACREAGLRPSEANAICAEAERRIRSCHSGTMYT